MLYFTKRPGNKSYIHQKEGDTKTLYSRKQMANRGITFNKKKREIERLYSTKKREIEQLHLTKTKRK